MTADKAKELIAEDKFVRRFLRILTGIILINYTAYIVFHLWTNKGVVPMNTTGWSILIGCLSIWAAWEGAQQFLNRKLGNK